MARIYSPVSAQPSGRSARVRRPDALMTAVGLIALVNSSVDRPSVHDVHGDLVAYGLHVFQLGMAA
jgi:hypothetical protein